MKKILCVNFLIVAFITAFAFNKSNAATQTQNSTLVVITNKKYAPSKNSFPTTWVVNNKKLFVFDPKIPGWAAYDENGLLIKTDRASGGKDYCEDIDSSCRTVTGTFRVYEKRDEDCVSTKFPIATDEREAGGAPMPYCMFFNGGYAIHGSNNVPTYNASHGCVRVTPESAQWLSEDFIEIGTTVLVLPYY